MNDRYLYRAKRIDNGEWAEGYYVRGLDMYEKEVHLIFEPTTIFYSHGETDGFVEVDPSTICQCTGLRDKNGKLIYEKNIVRDEDGSVGIVEFGVWNYYSIGFYIRWLSGNAKYYRNELGYWATKVEIIGSAFDNPELLEVET